MITKYRSSAVSWMILLPLLLLLPSVTTALWLPPPNSVLRHTSSSSSVPKHNNAITLGCDTTSTFLPIQRQSPNKKVTTHRPSSSLSFSLEDMIYNAQSTASSLASSSLSNFYSDNPVASSSSSSSTLFFSSSVSSLLILYFAGLLTSFSPCSLGLLPLTMSYISNAADQRKDKNVFLPTIAFASGLASVFCTLGLISSLVGGVFGSSGAVSASSSSSSSWSSIGGTFLLASLSSGISIAMGLQLLELIQLPLPSLDFMVKSDESSLSDHVNGAGSVGGRDVICTDTVCYASGNSSSSSSSSSSSEISFDEEGNIVYLPSSATTTATVTPMTTTTTTTTTTSTTTPTLSNNNDNVNSLFRTFLLGGSSALVASPCATPVLTSILAFVATSQDPILGATLLFTYTIGYSTLLLLVAASGGQALVNLQNNGSVVDNIDGNSRRQSSWMTRLGQWVNPLTATVLIWYGTNGFLEALLGDPSLAGLAPILD